MLIIIILVTHNYTQAWKYSHKLSQVDLYSLASTRASNNIILRGVPKPINQGLVWKINLFIYDKNDTNFIYTIILFILVCYYNHRYNIIIINDHWFSSSHCCSVNGVSNMVRNVWTTLKRENKREETRK